MAHANFDFAIGGGADDQMISFEPGLEDRVAPVIAPGVFARIRRLRLLTNSARGSPFEMTEDGRPVVRAPRGIFVSSGSYAVILQPFLGDNYFDENCIMSGDAECFSCPLEYFDKPRPKALSLDLQCNPQRLYHGDTLTVELPMSHEGFDFAVGRPDYTGDILVLKRLPGDKANPAISSAEFAKLRKVRLDTNGARDPFSGHEGLYLVMLGADLNNKSAPYHACWIDYDRNPRSKSGEQPLSCGPRTLYKGETLTVDLPKPHRNFDFAVGRVGDLWRIISFKPRPWDKIPPVIAPDAFAEMERVELSAAGARGSTYDTAKYPDDARKLSYIKEPPAPIFVKPGNYRVLLGRDLSRVPSDPDTDYFACDVAYYNRPRPKCIPIYDVDRLRTECK
ncbi:MAG TPA: hypothetical protein VNF29_08225 [Candidatus Binataceae bacterium]|nr:hypothetical protein [Candidatus Binataceae bacterium]